MTEPLACKDAIEVVLDDAGTPLHYQDITDQILDRGLWVTDGKTPAATVNAQLAVDIRGKGPNSRFIRTAPGWFALRTSGLVPFVVDKTAKADGTMTYLEAAYRVLCDQEDATPMHYKDITAVALDQGLLKSKGLTPDATMNAQIVTDVNKAEAQGGHSRFTKLGRGMFGLSEWMGVGVVRRIREHNDDVRGQLRDALEAMDPQRFEDVVGRVLSEIGFDEIEVTKYHGDKGIDVRGTLVVAGGIDIQMAVQVKKWKRNVEAPEVQKVRGAASANERGLIVTTSRFSKGAIEEATRDGVTPVGLIDGDQLIGLMVEHEIGVSRQSQTVIHFDEDAL